MSLSLNEKKELRKEIEKRLKDVPSDCLVKFDKELLEDLLFDVVVCDSKKGIMMRLPVWSGSFLQRIDLSEVDFTNVSWARLGCWDTFSFMECMKCIDYAECPDAIVDKYDISAVVSRYDEMFNDSNHCNYKIEYNNTNANIDLTKSFEALNENRILMLSCNFAGLDFSEQDLSGFNYVGSFFSKIGGTELIIPNDTVLYAHWSYLDGIILSNYEIDARKYFEISPTNLSRCCLVDCDVRIVLKKEDFVKATTQKIGNTSLAQALKDAINDSWLGCYLNDRECVHNRVRFARAQSRLAKHNEETQRIRDSINDSFNSAKKR